MQPAFSQADIFLARGNGIINIHRCAAGPAEGVPLAFVFDMISGDEDGKNEDADVRGDEVWGAKWFQEGSPSVENGEQDTGTKRICGSCPLDV